MHTTAHRWRLAAALAAGLLGAGGAGAQGLYGDDGQALVPGHDAPESVMPALPGEGESVAGITQTGWTSVFGFEFRGRSHPFAYTTSNTTGAMWCTGGDERFAEARLDVPDGVRMTFLRLWGFRDTTARQLTVFLFESCLPNLGAGTPVTTNLAEVDGGALSGAFTNSVFLADEPLTDTRNCTYWARVRFAASCTDGGQATLRKVRVQYSPE
jgi:hypothetical protein